MDELIRPTAIALASAAPVLYESPHAEVGQVDRLVSTCVHLFALANSSNFDEKKRGKKGEKGEIVTKHGSGGPKGARLAEGERAPLGPPEPTFSHEHSK